MSPTGDVKASYLVHRFGKRHLLELYEDQIVATVSVVFGTRFKIGYRLTDLDRNNYEIMTRDERLTALFGGMVVFGLFPFMAVVFWLFHQHHEGVVVDMLLLWLIGGGAFAVLHPFRIHHVNYRLRSGPAAFSVSKAGKNKAQRDAFVDAIDEALKGAEAKAAF